MKKNKILKIIKKNALVFLVGALIGIIVAIKIIFPYGMKKMLADKSPEAVIVSAIALIPVLLIIYGVLGILSGGFGSIVLYNLVKLLLKRRRDR